MLFEVFWVVVGVFYVVYGLFWVLFWDVIGFFGMLYMFDGCWSSCCWGCSSSLSYSGCSCGLFFVVGILLVVVVVFYVIVLLF